MKGIVLAGGSGTRLRVAMDSLDILQSNRAPGKQIYQSLKSEDILGDTEENTVNTYYPSRIID